MEKVNLEIWIMPNAAFKTAKTFKQELKLFSQKYPHINVRMKIHTWSTVWRLIMKAVKTNEGPDIFQLGSSWVKTLAYLGGLLDISKWVKELKKKEFFSPLTTQTEESLKDEKIYSLPWFVDVRTLFYRKDIFKKAGLKEEDIGNWASFEKACQKIANLRIKGERIFPLAVSGAENWTLIHDIAPWIWSGGGDFLEIKNGKPIFQPAEFIRGMKFFFELVEKYASKEALGQNMGKVMEDFFIYGRYAMHFSGVWVFSAFLNPRSHLYRPEIAKNIGIALPPAGPDGRYSFLGGSNLGIAKFSKHPKEAWKLIRFLNSPESQMRYTKMISNLPVHFKLFESFFEDKNMLNKFNQICRCARAFPQVSSWGVIETMVIEMLARVFQSVRRGKYNFQFLKREMEKISSEINFVLSL